MPRKLLTDGSLAELEQVVASGPESVVIKPVVGAGSTGVFLLRWSSGQWLDVRRNVRLSQAQLFQLLAGQTIRGEVVERWSAEELVPGVDGRHPIDWKVYMFADKCGLVLEKLHLAEGESFRWWSPDWRPVDVGKYRSKIDDDLPEPIDPDTLLSLAASVSGSLPLPFLRVDLIEGEQSYYLSEVSPLPGSYQRFSDQWDTQLGLLWEQAELAWSHRFLTDEQFQPALHVMTADVAPKRLIPN